MKTQILMSLSAMFVGVIGSLLIFMPQETLIYCGVAPTPLASVLVQITGALHLGFAMLNWMARANLIGGIYSRPVAIGNLVHFTVGALALVKFVIGTDVNPLVFVPTLCYTIFAVWFGLVVFTHPIKKEV